MLAIGIVYVHGFTISRDVDGDSTEDAIRALEGDSPDMGVSRRDLDEILLIDVDRQGRPFVRRQWSKGEDDF